MTAPTNTQAQWLLLNERLIDDALACVTSTANPNESVARLLECLGSACCCTRVGLFEESPNGDFDNTHEWCAAGAHSKMLHLQHVPEEALNAQVSRGVTLVALEWEGTQEDEPAHGMLYLDGTREGDAAERKNEVLANIIVKLLAATLAHRDELNLREENDAEDPLTGVSNRHGFYRFALQADPSECVGVICCELSGVREANRRAGHSAGDAALKELAHTLLENFRRPWVFRMGSSEFLVCCPGVQEDLFNRRVSVLLGILQAHKTPATVRTTWAADTQTGLEQLVLQAMSTAPRKPSSPTRHRHSHLWD